MNSDFKDLLSLFDRYNVRYLIVGGYAVMFHGEPRFTKDLDLFVSGDHENIINISNALAEFGFPLSDENRSAFAKPNSIIALGRPPSRVDILNEVPGITFDDAYAHRVTPSLTGQALSFVCIEDLIVMKRASGMPQDSSDAEMLESIVTRKMSD